jgi:hypothetical protein
MKALFLVSIFGFFGSSPLVAQPGCTDPLALNYDPGATVNNGSCVYPNTNYSLTLKTNLSGTLIETSGLVMANGGLWTHNDGGDGPKIYQIDSLTNTILKTVTLGGATNVDWEDITFDGSNFYVGDFGNNSNGNRTDLKIYKVPFSAIPSGTNVTVPAAQIGIINFSYEDQVNFNPTGANNTSFDCESIIYHDGELHLFTKDWINKTTTHYTLPATPGTYEAVNLETMDVSGLVTAADISEYGVIMLLGYQSAGSTPFFWILWDYPSGVFFGGNKRRINLGSFFSTGQIEGICFQNSAYGYISNERFLGIVPARLWSYNIAQWLQTIFFPVELVRFTARPYFTGARLEWETASEKNNFGFYVERSDDGLVFQQIGFVQGTGDSQTGQHYQFVDPEPGSVRYYRLRQTDFDGSEYLSPVVVLYQTTAPLSCGIKPNPVPIGQGFQFDGDIPLGGQLEIWSGQGQVIWQGAVHNARLPGLLAGIYFLQVRDARGAFVCRNLVLVR